MCVAGGWVGILRGGRDEDQREEHVSSHIQTHKTTLARVQSILELVKYEFRHSASPLVF